VTRFAIVTPSYYVDLESCRWLCETVDRWVPDRVQHYVIVDGADRALFAPLASSRRRIVTKEEVLGRRLRQLPFARKWWAWTRGLPVRGWIVQQLAKLFVHTVADEDVLLFVDSGAFFVRAWDPAGLVRQDGRVALFREQGDFFRTSRATQKWNRVAARLLGVRPVPGSDVGYVKTLVSWRRDNLAALHRHVEHVTGRPSFDALARPLTLSEYVLYGTYCDRVLGDGAGHYHTSTIETLSHWTQDTLSLPELRRLREGLSPEHVLVMVNEKSRTSLEAVRAAFRD
jgi:hypothetical protein